MDQRDRDESADEGWWRQTWEAVRSLWTEYSLWTRSITLLLGLLSLCSALLAALDGPWCGNGPCGERWAQVQRFLTSDGFASFLALLLALSVAISIKRQQRLGRLDGDEHYDIGRALAYGYFKNFLVGALLIARQEGVRLQVFAPHDVEELERFRRDLWPRIETRSLASTRSISTHLDGRPSPVKRTMLVLSSLGGGGQQLFDYPTALFTVHDYYESWNRWLADNDKPVIRTDRLKMLQRAQMSAFFRHLHDLSRSSEGVVAVKEFGLSTTELHQLFAQHLELVSLQDLQSRLSSGPG